MTNITQLKREALADYKCGTLGDMFADAFQTKFGQTLRNIQDADEQEREDLNRAIYTDMNAYVEKLCDQIRRARELNMGGTSKPARISMILNDTIIRLEEEGMI